MNILRLNCLYDSFLFHVCVERSVVTTTGAGDTDVEKMRSGFSDDGWSSDHLLPDWWFRVSSHNCLFISPGGELCESVEEVEDIIRHKSPCLIKNLKQFKLKLKK